MARRRNAGRYTPPKRRLALVGPLPDDAPELVREGLARRRIAATAGRCPCGATLDFSAAKPGTVVVAAVQHERNCPAADPAVEQWAATQGGTA